VPSNRILEAIEANPETCLEHRSNRWKALPKGVTVVEFSIRTFSRLDFKFDQIGFDPIFAHRRCKISEVANFPRF
jgi:hypothetical protein